MKETLNYMGLDVHKDTIVAAIYNKVDKTHCYNNKLINDAQGIRKLLKVIKDFSIVKVCYEAGPTGYDLKRQLDKAGVACDVIAPCLIPTTMNAKRRKNDTRDAKALAQLLSQDQLVAINVPNLEQEAARDLMRLRESTGKKIKASKLRTGSFLLKHGLIFRDAKAWTAKHVTWMKGLKLSNPTTQYVLTTYLQQVEDSQADLTEIDKQIHLLAGGELYQEKVKELCAFKGIKTLTAMVIIAEIVDFRRFLSAEAFMSYLGLVPSDYSSGQSERRGSITKDGNRLARKALVETSWHYRHAFLSKALIERQALASAATKQHATKALRRLNRRFHYLVRKGKCSQIAVVAVARELAGFIWAVMCRIENHVPLAAA